MDTVTEPDLEELLQDLHQLFDSDEFQSREVEELVQTLLSDDLAAARSEAAEQLAKLDASDLGVVKALIAALVSDPSEEVKAAAGNALQAPVHQEFLRQNPRVRWAAAVEAMDADKQPAKPGILPRLRPAARQSAMSKTEDVGTEHKVSARLALLLGILISIVLSLVAYALFVSGKLWILVGFSLVVFLIGGRILYVGYERARCPECRKPYAAELVRVKTIGAPKQEIHLSSSLSLPALESQSVWIEDRIYRCKYCRHRWRVTQQVIE